MLSALGARKLPLFSFFLHKMSKLCAKNNNNNNNLGLKCVSAYLHPVHVGLHLQLLHQLPGLCDAGRVIARHGRRHFQGSLRVLSAGREGEDGRCQLACMFCKPFNGDALTCRSFVQRLKPVQKCCFFLDVDTKCNQCLDCTTLSITSASPAPWLLQLRQLTLHSSWKAFSCESSSQKEF